MTPVTWWRCPAGLNIIKTVRRWVSYKIAQHMYHIATSTLTTFIRARDGSCLSNFPHFVISVYQNFITNATKMTSWLENTSLIVCFYVGFPQKASDADIWYLFVINLKSCCTISRVAGDLRYHCAQIMYAVFIFNRCHRRLIFNMNKSHLSREENYPEHDVSWHNDRYMRCILCCILVLYRNFLVDYIRGSS